MAGFSLGNLNMGGMVAGWLTSGAFWAVVCILLIITIWGGLVLRKRRMMDKNCLILYDLTPACFKLVGKNPDGSNKYEIDLEKSMGIMDFDIVKGGWFKSKFTLKGLIDYGNEKLFRLKDMTPVFDVSHNDYRNICGKKGIVCLRNPADPKFVIPISKFFLNRDGKIAMAEIAPVDLRNAATFAIEQVDSEMKTTWEKWAPIITVAIVAFVLIFSILLITQYGKHNVDSTTEILKYAIDQIGHPNTAVSVPSDVLVP